MTSSIEREITTALGRPLSHEEAGSIGSLNLLPEYVIAAARMLSPIARYKLLDFLAAPAARQYLGGFITDVFERGVPADRWGRGGVLVPSFDLSEMLALPIPELLSPLDRQPHEPWYRIPPNLEGWRPGEYLAGAPVIARPDLPYDWTEPSHVYRVLLTSIVPEPVADIDIATRRWIASRVAAVARSVGVSPRGHTPESLAEAVVPGTGPLSADARIALAGLIREGTVNPREGIPGFRGPDAWYAGSDDA